MEDMESYEIIEMPQKGGDNDGHQIEAVEETHSLQEESSSSSNSSNNKTTQQQWHDATCQLCLEDIRGEKWLCLDCKGWSVCRDCFHDYLKEVHPLHSFVRIGSSKDIYSPPIDEKVAPVVHLDVVCSSCHNPIIGPRFECVADECNDYNLCQKCEALPLQPHDSSHPMIKYSMPKMLAAQSTRISELRKERQNRINMMIRWGKGRGRPSRSLKWNSKTESFTCKWSLENISKTNFAPGWQLRRIERTVRSDKLIIDEPEMISTSWPKVGVIVGAFTLKLITGLDDDIESRDKGMVVSCFLPELKRDNMVAWFSESWEILDAKGRAYEEVLSFSFKFLFSMDGQKRKLVPVIAREESEMGHEGDCEENEECVITNNRGDFTIDIISRQ